MSNGWVQYKQAVTPTSGHALASGDYTPLYGSKGVDGAQALSIRSGAETSLTLR